LIVGIAVANYLRGVPTPGNDLVLVAILAMVGGAIGLASAQTVIMRGGPDGEVLARAGWASAFFLGPRDGLAVRVYLLDHPQRRRIDRRFQCPTRDYRERVDGRAARDGGLRSGRPLGVDGGSPSASARPPRFRVRLTPLPSLAVFTNLTGRTALTIRLVGLALVSWTVLTASHHPLGDSGRGLVISVLFVVCVVAWLMRVRSPAAAYRAIRPCPTVTSRIAERKQELQRTLLIFTPWCKRTVSTGDCCR